MLTIRNLQTGYGKVQILRGIDMSVPEGRIVALLGGNGTGKSTLLKAVSGLLPVWSGSIEFNGEEIRNRKPHVIVRRGLTQVTQGKDMYPAMTVEENLRIGAYTRSDKAGVAADMRKVFDYFPVLGERRRQLAATLSGGEVQMLVIGRGLMASPKLIMLDEPSSALAPRVVLDIFRNVKRINSNEGITILLVEQKRAHGPPAGRVRLRDPRRRDPHRGGCARPHQRRQRAPRLPRRHRRRRRGGDGPLRPDHRRGDDTAMDLLLDFIIVGLSIGIVYGLVALGISLIFSGLDIVHFAHGEVYMIGAFIGIAIVSISGVPYFGALVGAMIVTGIVGVVIERVFYRRLTRGGGGYTVAGMGMIICGFGMSVALQNVAYLIWGAAPHPYPVSFGMPIFIGNIALPKSYLYILVSAVVLMVVLHTFLTRTKLGLAVRAVAYNKDTSYLMGVNVPVMISLIFGVACAMAACAGVLIGPINYVQIEMGYLMLLKAFAAAVVGGFGSLPGALLGGVVVGLFETLCAGYLIASYKDIYAFLLLIVVLMVRPTGLLGIIVKVKA